MGGCLPALLMLLIVAPLAALVADVHDTLITDLIHPADVGRAQSGLNTAAAAGRVTSSEYRVLHGDGHWMFADVHSANLRHDPAVRGTVLTIRDSERKAVEAQSLRTRRCTTR
jgi:PAS domain-containing protein